MFRSISLLLISILFFLQPFTYCQITNVTTQGDFGKLIADNDLVIIEFYTTWCGACKAVEESFNQLSRAPETKDVIFAQVDIDILQELGRAYDITSIPHFLFFKNGKSVKQKQFESLETFKQDMLNEIRLLQNMNDNLAQQQKKTFSATRKAGVEQKGYVADFIELLTIPITFIMNLLEKLFNAIKGFFA